jgi:hypothetical protein
MAGLRTFQKSGQGMILLLTRFADASPDPVIDEGGKPVARSVIVGRTIGYVFVTLLRTRQFHAMRTTNQPTIHHSVRHFRMELQRVTGAQAEGLDRKSVAFRQELTAGR